MIEGSRPRWPGEAIFGAEAGQQQDHNLRQGWMFQLS